jgi:hypothetical protein
MPSKVYRDNGNTIDRDAAGLTPGRTRTSRESSLDNNIRTEQGVRRIGEADDENKIDRTMPQRNRSLQNETNSLQRGQTLDRSQREEGMERMQRDQSTERMQRQQSIDRIERRERENSQPVQRQQQVQEPVRRSVEPTNSPRQQREFNPVQRQTERPSSNTRTVTPQVQRQQPAQRQPQVQRQAPVQRQQQMQRSPTRTQSSSPTIERKARRGLD